MWKSFKRDSEPWRSPPRLARLSLVRLEQLRTILSELQALSNTARGADFPAGNGSGSRQSHGGLTLFAMRESGFLERSRKV